MNANVLLRQSFRARLAAVFAGELVNKVCVIAVFVWLARTVTPAVYGDVEWALSLTLVFTLFADAGLSTWGAAQVAARQDEARALVARIGVLRFTLAAPAYLALLVVAMAYGGRAGTALAIYGFILFLSPFFLQYFFNGLMESRWAALGQAVRGLTFAAAVFLLVTAESSPSTVAVAEVLGALGLALCNVLVARGIFKLTLHLPSASLRLGNLLARCWTIGASEVTWGVLWYAGLILLGYLATSIDVAWHSAALRLVMALHTIVWLYLYVLLPTLARVVANDADAWAMLMQLSLRLTGWIGYAIALVGTLAAGTILTTVFGPAFAPAAPGFRLAIWVVPIAWMSGHVRYSLIAAQHPKRDLHAALIGALTTIALAVLLAPRFRSLGAGAAVLGGMLANAVAAGILARNVLPPFAFRASIAASSASCLACLTLGAILTPVVGEMIATASAAAVLAALALIAERESVRQCLRSLPSALKPKWAETDVNT